MKTTIRLQSILDRFPDAEQVFTNTYEIELTPEILMKSLESVSDYYDLELEDLVMDIEEFIEESRQAQWLADGGESSWDSEQWTESLTEENARMDEGGFDEHDEGSEDDFDDG